MFKMQVQDNPDARAKLGSLYPVEVKMEKYTGPKTTRVVAILEDDEDRSQ